MISEESREIIRQAEFLYEQRLKSDLEKTNMDKYVAIEPVSGDYFLGQTFREATAGLRNAHPDRIGHVIRIGHRAAIHIGGMLL